jgi:hypothetical protein
MMRQRGAGDIQPLLQPADRHSALAGAHQQPVDAQARRVAKGFKAGGGIVELHGRRDKGGGVACQPSFRNIRNI